MTIRKMKDTDMEERLTKLFRALGCADEPRHVTSSFGEKLSNTDDSRGRETPRSPKLQCMILGSDPRRTRSRRWSPTRTITVSFHRDYGQNKTNTIKHHIEKVLNVPNKDE